MFGCEKMKFGLREEVYNKIKNIAQKYEYEFYIFGSRARGDFRNNSDIDIAILGDVSLEDEMKIKNEFDEIDMEYMIDIIFVSHITNVNLLDNIKKEGVIIK